MFCGLWDNYPPMQQNALIMAKNNLKSKSLIMATIYKAHGEVIDNIEPRNGNDFKLSELQSIVSGYIEIVNLYDGRIMVVNEEGRLLNLAINWQATRIVQKALRIDERIYGDVLVCESYQVE